MTTRTIRARLALAAERAGTELGVDDAAEDAPAETEPVDQPRSELELDEVLTMLDTIADDADALNAHIQALLTDHAP